MTDLERQLDEARRVAQQAAASGPSGMPEALPAEALPVLTTLSIDRLSDVRLRDDGTLVATIYVQFRDGRDRPVQGVGTLRAELLPAEQSPPPGTQASPAAAAQPAPFAQRELTPAEVRDAYRSGFTGTHYTITLEAPAPQSLAPGNPVRLRVRFDDARGGPTLEAGAERTIRPARTIAR